MWSAEAGVTAQSMRETFDGHAPKIMVIGTGEVEGAAGSLYYRTSLSFDSHEGPRRFAVTLRRSNQVPGASAEQLRWHIESMEQP